MRINLYDSVMNWNKLIFDSNVNDFDQLASQVMAYQLTNNETYRNYYQLVKNQLNHPYCFLPVEFFKSHTIRTGTFTPELIFESSTTSGNIPSKHEVLSADWYLESCMRTFQQFYGDPKQYVFLALLPSYLERGNSSLVFMCDKLIQESSNEYSGFYLNNTNELHRTLQMSLQKNQRIFLIGVTYALLDFADSYRINLSNHIVMETGGMKGRKQEMIRSEVHEKLRQAFALDDIHSEYGMTELMSQAYAVKDGKFSAPPWMKVIITDINDPFTWLPNDKAGRINIIDLANIHSCAFIQTSDIGKIDSNGTFEVIGRIDNSDSRGCSLMYI